MGDNSERWEQIEAVFFGALERGGPERTAFLEVAFARRPDLREDVEGMLAAHEADEQLQIEARFVRDEDAEGDPDVLNSHVGPYRLVRVLGEGGMGTVFLAERDDAQYRQEVALKLIRAGRHSSEAITRFRAERQILARLQHPNISRLLDGGRTEEGRPYLVMEYVEGTPITRYCDDRHLSIRERLRLFETVVRTVQFAHQNLVVHRDLKPTNILVTEEGEVRLLDFGIAKLLNSDTAELSVAETRPDVRVMTPEYAAPEQVRGEAITTATDVYALGVLLYELLTGHRPYHLAEQRQSEVERIICEHTPTRPSSVVANVEEIVRPDGELQRITPEHVSTQRATGVERLRRALAGDLDNIVMMALAKEPERRYAAAQQLAEDVARYLDGRIVIARKDTLGYRTAKFVRRHRAGVAVAAAFVLILIGFTAVTVWQAGRVALERDVARAERDRAELAQQKAEAVSEFLMDLFAASDPSEAAGDTITARELLQRGVERVDALAGQPDVQAEMLGVVGQVYRKLGQYDRSEALLTEALTRWRKLDDPAALARSLNHMALLQLDLGRQSEAESLISEGYALRRGLYSGPHLDLAESYHNLAGLAHEQGDLPRADSLFRLALAMRIELLGADHPLTIRSMRVLAGTLDRMGRFDEAEPMMREVLAMLRQRYGTVHPDVAAALNGLALLLKKRGDLAASAVLYRESLDVRRAIYGDVHPRVALALINYGKLMLEQSEFDAAWSAMSEALEIYRTINPDDHPDVAWALESLARVHADQGEHERALPLYEEALAVHLRTLGPDHTRTATNMSSLASTLQMLGRQAEAEAYYLTSFRIYRQAYGSAHANPAIVQAHIGRLYHRQGRLEEAEKELAASVEVLNHALPPGHLSTAGALVSYGRLLTDLGEPARAEPLLREALAARRTALPEGNPEIAEAAAALGACLLTLDRLEEAESMLLLAHESMRARPTADQDAAREVAVQLAAVRSARGAAVATGFQE